MENMGDNVALGLPSDVVVRRTVGMKKDEYLLNNKRADMQDVINLFETIGFSRCNPYNIVLQGQVEQLTAMSAAERLEVIKDIAGASLYDEKKAESEKLLKETEAKMEKVGEVILSLEDRIESLGAEKEELMAYQAADKRRRALEHRSRDLEMDRVEKKISDLDSRRDSLTGKSSSRHAIIDELESFIEKQEEELRDKQKKREAAEMEMKDKSAELSHLVALTGRLRLELKELEQDDSEDLRSGLEAQLEERRREYDSRAQSLLAAETSYRQALSLEKQLKANADEADRRLKELQAKKGRVKFSSKKERDTALNAEISHLQVSIEGRRRQTPVIEASIVELQKEEERLDRETQRRSQRHNELMETVKSSTEDLATAKRRRDEWADTRKSKWQEQKTTEEDIFAKRALLAHHQRQLHSTLPRELVAGLDAVSKLELPAKHKVYGPLIDLIEIPAEYLTAVEVTAGNTLFHILVDTDATASLVLNHLQRQNLGRVTCIPLNRVLAGDYVGDLNQELIDKGYEATPLTRQVKPHVVTFQPALNQVFGKTLACSSIEVASELSRQYKCACVALDGSQVNSKGALTGGFIDEKFNRIRSNTKIRELTQELSTLEKTLKTLAVDAEALDGKITESIKSMADFERKRSTALYELEAFSEMTRSLHRDLLSTREALNKRRIASEENEAAIGQLQKNVDSLTHERDHSPLSSQLSNDEAQELNTLSTSLAASLETELLQAISSRANAEIAKKQLEEEIEGKLRPQIGDLESKLSDLDMKSVIGHTVAATVSSSVRGSIPSSMMDLDDPSSMGLLQSKTPSLGTLTQAALGGNHDAISSEIEQNDEKMKRLQESMSDLESQIQELKKEIKSLLSNIAKNKENHSDELKRAAEVSEEIEKVFGEIASAQAKKEDLLKRLREIGILPSSIGSTGTSSGARGADGLEEIGNFSLDKCREELLLEKQKLSRFDHVNKKALDQFISFTEEKERFADRKSQMEKEYEAIQNLIDQLDLQKDNAVHLTFKGVSKAFGETFASIVPDGEAYLILRTRDIGARDKEGGHPSQASFTGIDLCVSFNKRDKNNQKEGAAIRQLSGGQRTVTSLSLIFAIQQCDRAPFYIFDEIDPALDDRYRNAIAEKIHTTARDGYQFVIVTHRPEMVKLADKNYIVSFSNRSSEINATDSETALDIVAQAEQEAEKQAARAQSTATKKRVGGGPMGAGISGATALGAHAPSTPKKTSAAPLSSSATSTPAQRRPSVAAQDDDDDEELVVRFGHRSADNEPMPFRPTEDDDLLETKTSRPKRGRQ